MILFKKDWLEPWNAGAIVDTQTSNESFIHISNVYKQMGIENHTFMLSLLNPELQGVDPFSETLTREEKYAIAEECKYNFWYYLREVARVPSPAGNDDIQFRANRGNIALYWLFWNHITTMLIQIRQTGKSTGIDILDNYLLNIRCTNTLINLLTKDDKLMSQSLNRLKSIMSKLPPYLNVRNRLDVGNTEMITVKKLENRYQAHLPNKSPKLADNVGRGFTSPITRVDEGAYLFNIEISLPVMLAANTAARDIAESNLEPYGTTITTTAGKKDDPDGRFMYKTMMEMAPWHERFFDAADRKELEQIVRQASPAGKMRVACVFNHRQLGYSDEWLAQVLEETGATGEAADRDFFNVWTSGSITSPLPREVLAMIRESIMVDHYCEISRPTAYVTRWFIHDNQIPAVMAQNDHVMSLDTSDAVGQDDIFMTLRDVKTGGITAAGNYNETNLITFCEWIADWLIRYPKITLIIERRSSGVMMIDYLLIILVSKGIDPFKRLYNTVVQDADSYPDRFKEIDRPMGVRSQEVYTKYKKTFGFATSASGTTSRSELYGSTLMNAAKYTGNTVRDPIVANQILSLVVRNGRVDHPPGEHDDGCVSWLLGYWLVAHGRNLQFYGIQSSLILSQNLRVTRDIHEQTSYEYQEQQHIRKEIERFYEEICKERDVFIVQRLEQQLRTLTHRLVLREGEKFSIDELLESASKSRRMHNVISRGQNSLYHNPYSRYPR